MIEHSAYMALQHRNEDPYRHIRAIRAVVNEALHIYATDLAAPAVFTAVWDIHGENQTHG
jgi:hypothetical protein